MDIGAAWRRIEGNVNWVRARNRILDHTMATIGHYNRVHGNSHAGGITYYAFLSFFPIMALIFFVVGLIADAFPDAKEAITDLINNLLEDLIGTGPGQVSLSAFENNAATAGVLGLIGLLYAGLGWISAMRTALLNLFALPQEDRPDFVMGKARDFVVLLGGGLLLIPAITVTSLINRYSGDVTHWLGLDRDSATKRGVVFGLGAALALALMTGCLVTLYKWLARPQIPRRALIDGALVAAVGCLLLWLIADRLIALTYGSPAFTIFGFALVLLILLNYFARAVLIGAAWAYTAVKPDLGPIEPAVVEE